MRRKPSRLKVEMAYNEGMWQEGFFEFGGHPATPARKPKRGRPRLTAAQREERAAQREERKKAYHQKYYLTVTKPKRRRASHATPD